MTSILLLLSPIKLKAQHPRASPLERGTKGGSQKGNFNQVKREHLTIHRRVLPFQRNKPRCLPVFFAVHHVLN